mgnify:CR=1 FL=1
MNCPAKFTADTHIDQLIHAGGNIDGGSLSLRVQGGQKEGLLGRKSRQETLLQRPLGNEKKYLDRSFLPHTVSPADSLLQNGRVPRKIHIDDRIHGIFPA